MSLLRRTVVVQGLVDGLDEQELADLARQLEKRVEDLNEGDLEKLVQGRRRLMQQASELAASAARAQTFLQDLTMRLAEIEGAARRAQNGESLRLTLKALQAGLETVRALTEAEKEIMQVVARTHHRETTGLAPLPPIAETQSSVGADGQADTRGVSSSPPPSARAEQAASNGLRHLTPDVREMALDRLRKTR